MSALDDIIAQDGATQQASQLDAVIAKDSAQATPAPSTPTQPAPAVAAAVAPPLGGFLTGVGDISKGATQSIVHALSWAADKVAPDSQFARDARSALPQIDNAIASQEQQYQAARQAQQSQTVGGQKPDPGIDWARLGGNMVGGAPFMAAAPEMAGGSMLGRSVMGGALGLANSALQPVTDTSQPYADQKGNQALISALTGGLSAPVSNALGTAISGAGGAAQKLLANAGVTMTPGQVLGGAFARMEEKATSLPILGDMIKNAQQRSVQSFNKAAYNDVLAPIGKSYDGPVGSEGVQAVGQQIGQAYDSALSNMTFRAADPQFQSDITNLAGMAKSLPPAQQQTFMNVLQTQVFGKLASNGQMDGPTLKGAQSELSRIARGYMGDPSFDNRQLGQAVGEIKNAIDNSLPRYNAPADVTNLANANASYAKFVRLRGATSSPGAMNNDGIFTAAQLQNSVRAADKSAGKGATATGNALMQDLSGAGQSVLGSKYPDSGTPGRAALMGVLGALGGGGATAAGFGGPTLAAGSAAALAALPYTSSGQKLAQALLMSRPQFAIPAGKAVSTYGPVLGATLAPALANGANR